MANNKKTLVYTGSFQPQFITSLSVDMDVAGIGDGIYVYELDEGTGALSLCTNAFGIVNPARLCCDEKQTRLYAASDTNAFLNWEAGTGGGLYAFDIQPDGALKLVGSRSSCGVRAVGAALDKTGQYLVVINEGSIFCTTEFVKNSQGRYEANVRRDEGCAVLLRVGEAGFEKVCDRYVLPEGIPAHPNTLHVDADNYVYIGNRGGNTLSILKLDVQQEKLVPVSVAQVPQGPGGFALHPVLPVFYASCPQSGRILIYRFDESRQNMELVQPVFEEEESNPGPLCLGADGGTLYAADTLRGEMKVYGVSQEGKLVLVQRIQQGLDFPAPGALYDLCVTSSGQWLLVSNMQANGIVAFPVLPDGTLGEAVKTDAKTPTGLLIRTV